MEIFSAEFHATNTKVGCLCLSILPWRRLNTTGYCGVVCVCGGMACCFGGCARFSDFCVPRVLTVNAGHDDDGGADDVVLFFSLLGCCLLDGNFLFVLLCCLSTAGNIFGIVFERRFATTLELK